MGWVRSGFPFLPAGEGSLHCSVREREALSLDTRCGKPEVRSAMGRRGAESKLFTWVAKPAEQATGAGPAETATDSPGPESPQHWAGPVL